MLIHTQVKYLTNRAITIDHPKDKLILVRIILQKGSPKIGNLQVHRKSNKNANGKCGNKKREKKKFQSLTNARKIFKY